MDAIILAGGFGTRLQKVVSDRPKPLALIQGAPFLDLLINRLKHLPKVILAIGYKAEQMVEYYSENPTLEFSIESTPLGTGGAIKQALSLTTTDDVLVLNGDSFLDFSLEDFYAYHRKMGGDLTLASLQMSEANRYGSLKFGPDHHLLSFVEKSAEIKSGWINGGVYLMKRSLFDGLSLADAFSFEQDLMPNLLNKEVFGYSCSGTFIDIGTESSYEKAQEILKPFLS